MKRNTFHMLLLQNKWYSILGISFIPFTCYFYYFYKRYDILGDIIYIIHMLLLQYASHAIFTNNVSF